MIQHKKRASNMSLPQNLGQVGPARSMHEGFLDDGDEMPHPTTASLAMTEEDPDDMPMASLEESWYITSLEDNMRQTSHYTKKMAQDINSLEETRERCETLIRDKFRKMQEILDQREDLLLQQLKTKYDERKNKLTNQMNGLQVHLTQAGSARRQARTLVARSEENKERLNKIIKLRDDCVYASPEIFQVPIDLNYDFGTEALLTESIANFGKLNFKRADRGKQLYFYETRANISEVTVRIDSRKRGNVLERNFKNLNANESSAASGLNGINGATRMSGMNGANGMVSSGMSARGEMGAMGAMGGGKEEIVIEKKEDVILPILCEFAFFYDNDGNKLVCEVLLQDTDSMAGVTESDEKQEMMESNQATKRNENIWLNIECVGCQQEQNVNWDEAQKSNFLLSGMNNDGGRYWAEMEKKSEYADGMVVYCRVRLVYYEPEVDISQASGYKFKDIAFENVVKGGKWSDVKMVKLESELQSMPPVEPKQELQLPKKIAFRCFIDVGNENGASKPILLQKKENEYTLNGLIEQLRLQPLVERINPKADFKIVLTKVDNKEIRNDEDLLQFCLSKAVDVKAGDLKNSLGMKAIMIESN